MHTPKHLLEQIESIELQIGRGQWLEHVATSRLEWLERVILRFGRQIRAELLRRVNIPPPNPRSRLSVNIRWSHLSSRARNTLLQIAKEHGGERLIPLAVVSQLDPYRLLMRKNVGRRTFVELRAALGI